MKKNTKKPRTSRTPSPKVQSPKPEQKDCEFLCDAIYLVIDQQTWEISPGLPNIKVIPFSDEDDEKVHDAIVVDGACRRIRSAVGFNTGNWAAAIAAAVAMTRENQA